MKRTLWLRFGLVAPLALGLSTAGRAQQAPTAPGRLVLAETGPNEPYTPLGLELTTVRPASVKKEPAYRGTPKYATLRLGNGPKSTFVLAVDQPEKGDFRIFVDRNQNGDLADDGDGAWSKRSEHDGTIFYGPMDLSLRASYGTASKETASADYKLSLWSSSGQENLGMSVRSYRKGTVLVDGKTWDVRLSEMSGDALFCKSVKDAEEAKKSGDIFLMGTRQEGGKPVQFFADIRAPFKIGEKVFEARVSDDGANLDILPTTKPFVDLHPPVVEKPLLQAGTPAPDFTMEKWGGGEVKLSDYRGQIVILDFWATWCGPCQQSLPHVEQIHQVVKGQPVVILAVCVWDTKKAYDGWVPKNQGKYTFQFAFDPSGRGEGSNAKKLFSASGIPTTYIIDKEGKVVEGITGYDAGDHRIEESLRKLGVKL